MQSTLSRSPRPSGLADVVELILDKGLVIDAFVRVSVVGIELLTVDARIVVASVDTYLRFAEAVNRLDLNEASGGMQLPDLAGGLSDRARHGATAGALEGGKEKASEVKESVREKLPGGHGEDERSDGEGSEETQARAEHEEADEVDEDSDERAEDDRSEGDEESRGLASRIRERGKVY